MTRQVRSALKILAASLFPLLAIVAMAEDRLGGQLSIVSAVLAAAPLALLIGYAAISIKNGEGGRSGESAGP